MLHSNRILVATDFSDDASPTLERAGELARSFDAELHVVHVVEHMPGSSEDYRSLENRITSMLMEIVADLGEDGVPVAPEPHIKVGRAFKRIIGTADFLGADLIVMGRGTRGVREGSPLGQTTDRVMRTATCPVFVVHPEIGRLQHILCPVDFSEWSREALRSSFEFGSRLGGRVSVLNVMVERPHYPHLSDVKIPVEDPWLMFGEVQSPDRSEASRAKARQDRLRAFVSDTFNPGVPVERRIVKASSASEGILAVAEEEDAELVVMGSSGGGDAVQPLLGNTTEKVSRRLACSFMSVRSPRLYQLGV
jgi:nucleotide-binding universal stress UspA family protein